MNQQTDKPLSIEERIEQAVLELEPSLMCARTRTAAGQSDPLCQVAGCGRPRSEHYRPSNSPPVTHAPQTRSGPGEKRKHEEELNPAGNRFRMKWWNWWDDARINIRTGPPDRRKAQPGQER